MQAHDTLLQKVQQASKILSTSDVNVRNAALLSLATILESNRAMLQTQNAKDIANAKQAGLKQAFIDRLVLDDKAITAMIQAVREIHAQPEVLGEVVGGSTRASGIAITQVRVPLGVVLMIYESRPNVTIDASALCLKSGNAALLKGGKEAYYSNIALLSCVAQALESVGLPSDCVYSLCALPRDELQAMLSQKQYIDVVIPRGGSALIEFVTTHSKIPVIFHDKGVCHAYIDESAPTQMAVDICLNAKTSRPSACNAIECILLHQACATRILSPLLQALCESDVEVRLDSRAWEIVESKDIIDSTMNAAMDSLANSLVAQFPTLLHKASAADFGVEFGAKILALRIVDSIKDALSHIETYGSKHSEIIITQELESARFFCDNVDASAVFVNASSRFNDGGEFGLGAEIGISTQKLHARGPMGAVHLTTTKYIVQGNGTIRV